MADIWISYLGFAFLLGTSRYSSVGNTRLNMCPSQSLSLWCQPDQVPTTDLLEDLGEDEDALVVEEMEEGESMLFKC